MILTLQIENAKAEQMETNIALKIDKVVTNSIIQGTFEKHATNNLTPLLVKFLLLLRMVCSILLAVLPS